MTIAEIESTLSTLCIRHPNLDDELLVTLLTAGGWEDKVIQDAVTIFKSSPNKYRIGINSFQLPVGQNPKTKINQNVSEIGVVVAKDVGIVASIKPSPVHTEVETKNEESSPIVYYNNEGKEEKVLPVFFDSEVPVEKKEIPVIHNITEVKPTVVVPAEIVTPLIDLKEKIEIPIKEVISEKVGAFVETQKETSKGVSLPEVSTEKIIEPQSLILQDILPKVVAQKIDPPENLPLKPFESTPHVWPFSKYKEVFHGETMLHPPTDEMVLVNNKAVVSEEHKESHLKKIKIKRTGFDSEDEGLIFLTGTTLLVILLLLAYMYSNGRL
jgi:hypothetical protein